MPKLLPPEDSVGVTERFISDRYFRIDRLITEDPDYKITDPEFRTAVLGLAYFGYSIKKKDKTEERLAQGARPTDFIVTSIHRTFDDDKLKDEINAAHLLLNNIVKKLTDADRERSDADRVRREDAFTEKLFQKIERKLDWRSHIATAVVAGIVAALIVPSTIEGVGWLLDHARKHPDPTLQELEEMIKEKKAASEKATPPQ